MDTKRTGIRPAAVGAPMQTSRQKGSNAIVITISVVVAVVLLALAGWLLFAKDGAVGTTSAASSALNKDKYQAVFLSNGQVYFGKLQNTAGDSLVLKDIYYLQVDSKIQPSSGDNADVSTKENSDNSDVQLIKLGNELHGPEDQMQITKDQVLFWENLKADGKVSKAIDSYVKE